MVRVTAVGMKCTWAASWPRWYKLPSTDFTGPDVACKSLAATFSEAQIHKHCRMQANLIAIVGWLNVVVISVQTEWLVIAKTLFTFLDVKLVCWSKYLLSNYQHQSGQEKS